MFGKLEADVDCTDLDFMKKYEDLTVKMATDMRQIPMQGKQSDVIMAKCKMVFWYFESLFGRGAAKKLFGAKTNMRVCDEAMLSLAQAVQQDNLDYAQETMEKTDKIVSGNESAK